ncbi:hypothetical protein BGZ65_005358 [Modicella reniformis]|uniref:Uncharacterized protein n=1 Tax=Modicella reniformis TaxID=1440133 RepID=A0A9P6IK88_9FUNG|nr:hypothetical protein BGZ65_005358 [Modicella reniformis]
MRHLSIRSFEVTHTPPDLFQRSSPLVRNNDLYHLRHLGIKGSRGSMLKMEEITSLKSLVANAPNLTSLGLESNWELLPELYSAVVGYQTYPIDFFDNGKNILRIPLPPRGSISVQNLEQLFKVHGGLVETFSCKEDGMQSSILDALAEATQSGSRLKELNTNCFERKKGDNYVKSLASIVSRSELRRLSLDSLSDAECARIVESIQWEHLRSLEIDLDDISQRSMVEALVNGVGRMSLEHFTFGSQNSSTSTTEEELLRSFVSSTSLKHLNLLVTMTFDQILSVIKSADVSRLQRIELSTKDFDSTQVQAILDVIQHATELQNIVLHEVTPTEEQKEQMKAKGIELSKAPVK